MRSGPRWSWSARRAHAMAVQKPADWRLGAMTCLTRNATRPNRSYPALSASSYVPKAEAVSTGRRGAGALRRAAAASWRPSRRPCSPPLRPAQRPGAAAGHDRQAHEGLCAHDRRPGSWRVHSRRGCLTLPQVETGQRRPDANRGYAVDGRIRLIHAHCSGDRPDVIPVDVSPRLLRRPSLQRSRRRSPRARPGLANPPP